MPVQTSRRLGRYALISVLSLAAYIVALVLGDGTSGLVVLVASIPFVLAWGPYQAEIAMNPDFDDVDRRRWRIALYVLPWLMTLYWYRYVRGVGVEE
jgi:hypothetical protein